jgi:hypothetical protein
MDGNQLKDWSKKNNKFLKLENGESLTATLKSAKPIVKDSFGEEKEVIRYTFVTDDGHEKIFDNGSAALASILAEHIGQVITIKREGEREKTRYIVKKPGTEDKNAAGPESVDWEP